MSQPRRRDNAPREVSYKPRPDFTIDPMAAFRASFNRMHNSCDGCTGVAKCPAGCPCICHTRAT